MQSNFNFFKRIIVLQNITNMINPISDKLKLAIQSHQKEINQTGKFCIYSLVCPIDNIIKYIGCTKSLNSRYSSHITSAFTRYTDNKNKSIWLRNILKSDQYPVLKILGSFNNEQQAADFEMEQIKIFNPIFNYSKRPYNYKSIWRTKRQIQHN